MRIRLLIVGGLLLGMSGWAMAADLAPPRKAAPYFAPAPVFTWTGFYVGANLGYGFGNSTIETAAFGSQSFNTDGVLGGTTFGYNWQAGSFVYGLEGDLDLSALSGTGAAVHPCISCKVTNPWFGTVRGRLGYSPGPWMVYATGGLAYGGIKLEDTFGGSDYATRTGWTAGAGVEYAFAPRWSAKLEYLYVDYGDIGFANGITTTVNENIIRAGVNYKLF